MPIGVFLTPHITSMTQPETDAPILMETLRRHRHGESLKSAIDRSSGLLNPATATDVIENQALPNRRQHSSCRDEECCRVESRLFARLETDQRGKATHILDLVSRVMRHQVRFVVAVDQHAGTVAQVVGGHQVVAETGGDVHALCR